MRHNTALTSVVCYHDMRQAGTITKRQLDVMAFMQDTPKATRRQIAKGLDWDTGSAAGRVNELVDMNYLVKCGTVKCPKTGNTVGLVCLPEMQGEMVL